MGACLSRSDEQQGQTLVVRKNDRGKVRRATPARPPRAPRATHPSAYNSTPCVQAANGKGSSQRGDRLSAGGELFPSGTCNLDSGNTLSKEYKRLASDPIHQGPQGATRVIGILADRVLSEKQGDAGDFKVLRRLGKGGFGVVWLCARTKPDVRSP